MKKLIMLSLFTYTLSFTPAAAQGAWSPRTPLPDSARGYGVGFSIGNYGYVGLGGKEGETGTWEMYNDFWQFDPSTNTWTRKADFPGKARICASTFVIGNYAYVVCGAQNNSGSDLLTECWQYNSITDTWIQKNNFPGLSRYAAAAFAIGKNGYLGTGYDTLGTNNSVLNDFWEYDTSTDSWTQKADFGGIRRYGAAGFAVGGKGYICFGADSFEFSYKAANDMWEYDTGADSWTQKSSNPSDSLAATSGFVIGNNIYVGIGETYYPVRGFSNFWQYNIITDTWTEQTSFIGGKRIVCSAFAINDTGYDGLGVYDSSLAAGTNTMYRFLPDSTTGINEILLGQELVVFPNPAYQKLNIKFNEQNSGLVTLSIMDITGREVLSCEKNVNNDIIQIDVSSLPPAMYFISIKNKDMTIIQKFIKINN
jgi:N-acetylneuraminic acid mutarotase